MTNFESVRKFMETFGQEIKKKAEFPNIKITELRYALIKEELGELKEAIENKDRSAFKKIIKTIEGNDVIEYCKEVAKKYRDLAIAEIEDLGSNHASEDLRRLCQISVDRIS